MNMCGSSKAGFVAALAVFVAPAMATGAALDIPPAYEETAAMFEIPPDIFYAVALQESGRHIKELGRSIPWLWTLNVEDAGYYYSNQEEAWDALRVFVENGATNIGVGPMQVTWPYNQYALVDVYSALEPTTNLRLGAQILRACFDRLNDWWQAVGCYHQPGSSAAKRARAETYRRHVKRRWRILMAAPSK